LFIGNLFAAFQNWRDDPCRFSKALGATPRHLSSNRNKGFEIIGFEKLAADSKALGAKQLRTKLIQSKIKGTVKKLQISAGLSPNQDLSNLTTKTVL
jgi:hypothetical protein